MFSIYRWSYDWWFERQVFKFIKEETRSNQKKDSKMIRIRKIPNQSRCHTSDIIIHFGDEKNGKA